MNIEAGRLFTKRRCNTCALEVVETEITFIEMLVRGFTTMEHLCNKCKESFTIGELMDKFKGDRRVVFNYIKKVWG